MAVASVMCFSHWVLMLVNLESRGQPLDILDFESTVKIAKTVGKLDTSAAKIGGSAKHFDAKNVDTVKLSAEQRPMMRLLFLVVGLFTAWHIFASFLWIGPVTPLRELIPGNLLYSYMIPWFGQSWSVFAPEPINGDYIFKVRATVKDGSGEKVTPWVDATKVEYLMAQYNFFPPRAANLAGHQASLLFGTYGSMTTEQKAKTVGDYYKGDVWLGDLYVNLGKTDSTTNYVVQERYTAAYATQVAVALWGKDNVLRIQFDVGRQNVIPYEQRHNPAAKPEPYQPVTTGWRGLLYMPGQSEKDFADVFVPAFERSGQVK